LKVEGNKRKYSLQDIEDIYLKRGQEIFPTYKESYISCNRNPLKKWLRPKYNPEKFNNILTEYFGHSRITSCLSPIFITTYDIHRNKPIYFTTREASLIPERNPKLVDICRATSAAPTYFPSYKFPYDGENVICIDGGIFMNNPSLGALVEVLGNLDSKYYRTDKVLNLKDIFILSLGTGKSNKIFDSIGSEKWGQAKWIKPIIELTMNGPVKAIDNQLKTIYNMFRRSENYLRINIDISEKYAEMSDTRKVVTDYLIEETASQILNNNTLKLRLDVLLEESGIIKEKY